MSDGSERTLEGDAATDLILRVFRANGAFLAAGDRLAGQHGLTSARWQVLGAVVLADRPLTVAQIARRMGLTRQSVQASTDRLLRETLVEAIENLDHRRSPLIRLTDRGRVAYSGVDSEQARWINRLAAGVEHSELTAAARILTQLTESLDTTPPPGGKDT